MIIIEGADLVGKTTLAKTLLGRRYLADEGYWYKWMCKPPINFDGCRGYIDMAYMKSVQDRFHMSEIVYRAVDGMTPCITPEKYRLVDAHLRLMGVINVLIICTTEDLIKERHKLREELYDEESVCRANYYFGLIADSGVFQTKSGTYRPDVDIVIRTGSCKPFPDDSDVKKILQLYDSRLGQLANALGVFE